MNFPSPINFKSLPQLLRAHQWYKNLVVFLAVFFSGNLFTAALVEKSVLAFVSLSLISSAGYIINDLRDRKEDALHPEKRHRPLAAGKISLPAALFFALLLSLAGFYLSFRVNVSFLIVAITLFVLTQVYTFFLKKIIFADVIAIASLFVLRAIAGAIAIDVYISPWLVLVPFFFSLFLSAGKRHSDLHLLQEKAGETKQVLKQYTHEVTSSLMTIATTLLILSYAIYSFLSEHPLLITTLPFALYLIFRVYYLIGCGSIIARQPEKMISDRPLIIGTAIFILITAAIIYLAKLA